jgi:hypothetical protein
MNTVKKISMSTIVILGLSGCAATSTYKNYSTPTGNRVEATGQAAVAAGANNGSYNCINCGGGYGGYRNPSYGGYGSYQQSDPMQDAFSRITGSASSAAAAGVSTAIYDSIFKALQ